MDVKNLYINIDVHEGIQAVTKVMTENPDPNRPDKELLELLWINLTRNDFLFDDKYYLQTKGTAMWKKFAPAYANIFMSEWEKVALEKAEHRPMLYYRFLDDRWGVWTESEEKCNQFINILYSINSSISITAEFNKEQVNFLDITIFKGTEFNNKGILDTKVSFKTTDTHALLHRSSYHPKHKYYVSQHHSYCVSGEYVARRKIFLGR